MNVIDTAHTYAGGQSEETIGAALLPIPDGCIVATKGGWNGARPETLRVEIEESLRRLRTDSIALYYLHRVDPQTPLEESLGAIKEYRDSGKIRQVGVSNVGIEQIERARQVVPISAVQDRFNLSERTYDDVADYCAREGLVFLPYFPLPDDAADPGDAFGRARERERGRVGHRAERRRVSGPAVVLIPFSCDRPAHLG